MASPLAKVLPTLGIKRALIVHGTDGMDEISVGAPTQVHEVRDGKEHAYEIRPEDFGFSPASKDAIRGGTPEENAKTLIRTLKGEEQGAKFDIVVFNAMFALYTADGAKSPDEAKKMVLEAINSGKAYKFYEEFIKAGANGVS